MMNMEMRGKVAIVTGGSSGIGKATAMAFARAGARVGLVARKKTPLEDVANLIKSAGGDAIAIPADVTIEKDCERIIDDTVRSFGKLDVLVNAAGMIFNGTIENTTLARWDEMFNLHVRAVFYLTQVALPHLLKTQGNVVNVSSINGERAFPNVLAYCTSKAAVDQLTRCVALELAPRGVRVNAICPGVTVTELHRSGGMDESTYQRFLEHSKETHPLGRVGNPEEIANLILYLASPQASWITGVTYLIDGGRGQTCLR